MSVLNHERDIYVNTNVMPNQLLITNVMTIADRLKQAREKLGLTQLQLAEKAGVAQGTIANVENGIRKKPREITSIARALAVDAAWLEAGKGDPYPSNQPDQHIAAERNANWTTDQAKIGSALDTLEHALAKLDMHGRERMAPMFESFARSPGAVIKKDIAMLLENPDTIKSPQASETTYLHKTG